MKEGEKERKESMKKGEKERKESMKIKRRKEEKEFQLQMMQLMVGFVNQSQLNMAHHGHISICCLNINNILLLQLHLLLLELMASIYY